MRRDFFTGSFDFPVLLYGLTLQRELIGGESKIQMDVFLHSIFSPRLWFFLLRKKLEGDCGQWILVTFFLLGGDVYGGLLAGKPLMILLSVALSLYSGADLQEVIFIKKKKNISAKKKKKNQTHNKQNPKQKPNYYSVLWWTVLMFFSWPFGLLSMIRWCSSVNAWCSRSKCQRHWAPNQTDRGVRIFFIDFLCLWSGDVNGGNFLLLAGLGRHPFLVVSFLHVDQKGDEVVVRAGRCRLDSATAVASGVISCCQAHALY